MAIYHLTVKTGSRQGGQSAAAKVDYIEREGKYRRDPSEVLHSESGNLPAFARHDHRAYWQAADLHERANGRLFKEVEFALPVELSLDQQRQLAHDFAQHLTGEHRLPYTLAIHRGDGTNPHCHLIVSERQTDEHQRTAAQHFARYNAKQPERGGAQKSDALKPKEWLAQVRADWAERANAALERAGHAERIDHRSLEAQGVDRMPPRHLGPAAVGYEQRTGDYSRRRLDIRADRQAVLERLQAAKAAGEELRAAESVWARSALDVRSLERERAELISSAIEARDALFARYRAGDTPADSIDMARARGLHYNPETAAEAQKLASRVEQSSRGLDEYEAKKAAAAAAPKPSLAELIQQPQQAPEPVRKVDTPAPQAGTDLRQLLAQGEQVATSPPSPPPVPEQAPGLTLEQHQVEIDRRIKERTVAIGLKCEDKATAPARERLQGAQERLKAALPRIENADRQAFSDASRERTAQRGAEAEAKRLASEAEQWRATHWMQTKVGRTGPADELDGRAEGQRSRALVHQRAADEAEARREALAREKRQLEREVEAAERSVETARQEARRRDQGLDGCTAARQVIDEYRREHPDYAQQADQHFAQERERKAAEEAQREAQQQALEQSQDMGRSR